MVFLPIAVFGQYKNSMDSLVKRVEIKKDTAAIFDVMDALKPIRGQFPDSSIKILTHIQPYVYRTKVTLAISTLQLNKGRDLNSIGKYDEAIVLLDSALTGFKKIKYTKGIGSAYHNKGVSLVRKGELDKALKMLIQSEKYFLQAKAYPEAITAQQTQAGVFLELDNTAMALKVFKRAEKLAIDEHNDGSLLFIRTNIGSVYNKREEFDKAIPYYLEAIKQAKETNNVYIELAASSNLGTIWYAQHKLDEAITIELRALELAKLMGDVSSQIAILNNLASAYASKKNLVEANKYADQSLELLKTNQSLSHKMHALLVKADILHELGKSGEAFDYLKQHNALKDSLLHSEQQATMAELETKYNDFKQEQKIKDLNTNKQLTDLKLEKSEQAKTIYLILSIAVALILLLVIGALVSNKNKNKLLAIKNKQIEENLKEKEILLMEVHHRVKNNLQMIYSILNMQSKTLPKDVADILNENKDRIRSISIVHEKLYRTDDLININLKELITDIATNAQQSSPYSQSTQINVKCDEIKPDLDTMLSIGIMINELVTNAFKYAFENNRQNQIDISIQKINDQLLLKVNDNGKGFPIGFSPSQPDSFGFKMIQTLCKKLKGQITCTSENGAKIEITMNRFALLS